MRLLLHFARFGPYHHARLRAVTAVLAPLGWEVIGLQTASLDTTYDWRESLGGTDTNGGGMEEILTVFPGRVYEEIPSGECRRRLVTCLNELSPDAIAVPGWGSIDARVSLGWCRRHGAKAIIMSETRENDGPRRWWKERIKSLILRNVHGALVGGAAHRSYLAKLGVPEARIRLGYNVVDNAYFVTEAARWREQVSGGEPLSGGSTHPFFLASNRFIERKNLGRLIEAYARYTNSTVSNEARSTEYQEDRESPAPWHLCLLGDGPLRQQLISQCHSLDLAVKESAPWELDASQMNAAISPTVFFPGFRQIEELPRFYAGAEALVHPALEEPWGLVINEAMASGLPVLSGNNVGAAAELIIEGRNGWTFDAGSTEAITHTMIKLMALRPEERLTMGRVSAEFLEENYPTSAFGCNLREILEIPELRRGLPFK